MGNSLSNSNKNNEEVIRCTEIEFKLYELYLQSQTTTSSSELKKLYNEAMGMVEGCVSENIDNMQEYIYITYQQCLFNESKKKVEDFKAEINDSPYRTNSIGDTKNGFKTLFNDFISLNDKYKKLMNELAEVSNLFTIGDEINRLEIETYQTYQDVIYNEVQHYSIELNNYADKEFEIIENNVAAATNTTSELKSEVMSGDCYEKVITAYKVFLEEFRKEVINVYDKNNDVIKIFNDQQDVYDSILESQSLLSGNAEVYYFKRLISLIYCGYGVGISVDYQSANSSDNIVTQIKENIINPAMTVTNYKRLLKYSELINLVYPFDSIDLIGDGTQLTEDKIIKYIAETTEYKDITNVGGLGKNRRGTLLIEPTLRMYLLYLGVYYSSIYYSTRTGEKGTVSGADEKNAYESNCIEYLQKPYVDEEQLFNDTKELLRTRSVEHWKSLTQMANKPILLQTGFGLIPNITPVYYEKYEQFLATLFSLNIIYYNIGSISQQGQYTFYKPDDIVEGVTYSADGPVKYDDIYSSKAWDYKDLSNYSTAKYLKFENIGYIKSFCYYLQAKLLMQSQEYGFKSFDRKKIEKEFETEFNGSFKNGKFVINFETIGENGAKNKSEIEHKKITNLYNELFSDDVLKSFKNGLTSISNYKNLKLGLKLMSDPIKLGNGSSVIPKNNTAKITDPLISTGYNTTKIGPLGCYFKCGINDGVEDYIPNVTYIISLIEDLWSKQGNYLNELALCINSKLLSCINYLCDVVEQDFGLDPVSPFLSDIYKETVAKAVEWSLAIPIQQLNVNMTINSNDYNNLKTDNPDFKDEEIFNHMIDRCTLFEKSNGGF